MTTKVPLKPWTNTEEQLELLHSRGLLIDNEKVASLYLKTIGYYRLSGYLYPFREMDNTGTGRRDRFVKGSRFDDVRKLYIFDKKLRGLALDALERIEIALRVNIVDALGNSDSAAHKNPAFFQSSFPHTDWLNKYEILLERAKKTDFVVHHLNKYQDLPIWVASEVWDFGAMSKLYRGLLPLYQDGISKIYRIKFGSSFQTHLHGFNFIRNTSAHHSRLWNRAVIGRASLKGLQDPQWKSLDGSKPFVYFCLMKRMLDIICPNSTWGERFLALVDEFPQVNNGAVELSSFGWKDEVRQWSLWQA